MNSFKRFLSLALAVLMMLSYAPTIVYAAEGDIQLTEVNSDNQNVENNNSTDDTELIGEMGEGAYNLQIAISEAENGGTVTLSEDVVLEDTLTIPVGKTVTIDLAGHTISQTKDCTASYEMIYNKGYLTITGGGKISFTDTGAGDPNFGWGSYTIRNEGTLVVENGTIEHLGQQNANGRVKHMYCAIFQYSGSTTINGGTISTPTYRSVRLWKGDMTINGGNFEGQVWVQSVDDSAKLTITNGTFAPRGVDGSSVFIGNITNTGVNHNVELKVSGGTFTTKIGVSNAENVTGDKIIGGTFIESAVSGTNGALLAEGFEFDKDGTVVEKDPAEGMVAKIGNEYYATLADAIANAKSGDTITLLDNVKEDVTIDKAVTIDGAGKTYTGKMTLKADTTIKNVNFDGNDYNGYAVETRGANYVTIEDCTAKNYGYGFLQLASGTALTTVKNVTISDMNYGVKIDYSNAVVLDNVVIDADVAAVLNSNYGEKTVTIKDSDISILGTWTRNDTTKTNYVFEGENTIDEFIIDKDIDTFKLEARATLTAPNEINVTVTGGYNVEYKDGKYVTVKEGLEGSGTAEDPYLINSLDELKLFRDKVNAGTTYDNQFVKLTADIDLNSEEWTPIGNSTNKFLGAFDGDNHTISNLVVNVNSNHAGLFGFASVIKNVKLVNANVTSLVCVGALVGELESSVGTVDNCHVSGTIKITGENSVGGLAGKGYANIKNSTVDGGDDENSFVLGVAGTTEEGDNVGGIIGHLGEGVTLGVSDCTAENITVKGTRKVGGIVGTTARANDMVGNTVEDIVVECIATEEYANDNASTTTIGGIVGNYFGSATSGGVLKDSTVTNVTFVVGNAKSAGALVGGDRVNNGGAPVGIDTVSGNVVSNVTGATNNHMMVAEVNGVYYSDLQDAIDAANGEKVTIKLINDILLDDINDVEARKADSNGNGKYCGFDFGNGAFFNVIGGDVTIDLNGHSITYNLHDDAWCNKRVVSIFYATDEAKLTVVDNSENKTGAVTVYGMATAVYSVAVDTVVTINGGTWTWYPCKKCDATNAFLYASHGGELYVKGGSFVNEVKDDAGDYMFFSHYSSKNTETNSAGVNYSSTKIAISGGTFEGYNPNEIKYMDNGNGNAEKYDSGCADEYIAIENSDGSYGIEEKVELPKVDVNDITEDYNAKNENPLTFALNFAIGDTKNLTDEYLEKLFRQYGHYYTDYVLTISGLTDESVTFNADGNANGYLGGQYDNWSENWVYVPFDDVTVNNGESLYIMEYAAKLLNQSGLRFTLAEIAEIVVNFDCGVYFTPEFLKANPDMEVTLELKVFTEDKNGNKIADITVATNKFTALDAVAVASVTDSEGKETKYGTVAEALAAAEAGDTITLFADVEASEVIEIGKSLTINGNGHKITSSASRVIRVTTNDVEVTLNDVNMVSTAVRVGTSDVRGISIDAGLSNVKLTLNNCSVDFTDASANDWAYAVNVSGNGTGHTVTVNGGTYEGANVINVNGANNTVVVKDAILNCTYPNNDMYAGACIWVLQEQSSSVEANDNTFNGTNAVAFNLGTGNTLTESNNTDNTKFVVAKVGDTYYTSLADAVAAANDGDTVKLLHSVELSETVVNTKTVTIDLNGKTIIGTDNNTSDNFYLINNNKGNLTITDNSDEQTGKITLKATTERNWTASSVVVANNLGTLTIKGGTIEHLGGTSMAYGIDNLTNGANTVATLNIEGGKIDSTYFAIRQFANNGTNNLKISGGEVGYAWMQSPNANANVANINITGGKVAGLCLTGVNAVVTLSAKADCVGEVYGTMPAGKALKVVDGCYVLAEAVASVTDSEGTVTNYTSLQEAIDAAKNSDVVTLLKDNAEDVTVVQAPDVVITIDGNNKTMTGTITVNGKSAAYATAGLTIKNVKFDATNISKDASINLGGNDSIRYTSNVTVENCTFTGNENNEKVAVKSYTGGDKNLIVTGCTATGMHSLVQVKNVTSIKIEKCSVTDSKNGISLGRSSNAVITETTINVDGYGVRADADAADDMGDATITNYTITAELPVVIRKATADGYKLTVIGGTITAYNENGYGVVFTEGDDGTYEEPAVKFTATVDESVKVYPTSDYEARIGDVNYFDIEEAIMAALTGSDKNIVLLKDVEIEKVGGVSALILYNGINLDLNGNKLIVDNFVALGTAQILDNSTDKTGVLVAPKTGVVFNPANGQMPVYNVEDNGYKFATMKMQDKEPICSEGTAKFEFRHSFGKYFNETYLSDGASDNGVTIQVVVSWIHVEGQESTPVTQAFTFSEELIKKVYGENKTFFITISGLTGLGDVTISTSVVSEKGVVCNGNSYTNTY